MQPIVPQARSHAPDSDDRPFGRLRQERGLRLVQDGARGAAGTEDKIPLFLSDPQGEPRADEFMPPARPRRRPPAVIAGLAAVAVVAVAGTVYAAMGRLPFSSASTIDARISPVTVVAVATTPPAQDQRSAPAPVKDAVQPSEPPRVAETAANAPAPSREALVAAYQSALQSQGRTAPQPSQATPAVTPPPAAEAPAPQQTARHLPPEEIAALLKRGSDLIASRDIAAARLVLRRAAEAGDARAATRLAETYDPAVLARMGVRGIVGDAAQARTWYDRAAQFSAADARPAQRP